MDKLGTFIKTLSLGEKISFRNSLRAKTHGKDNKKLILFDLLVKEKSGAEIRQILYKDNANPDNAYYQLRKALIFELETFLIQNRIWTDHRSEVYRKIDVAHYFTGQLQYQLAWNYLTEAEELATTNGFVEILNVIYSIKAFIAEHEPAFRNKLPELVSQKIQNLDLLRELWSFAPGSKSIPCDKILARLEERSLRKGGESVIMKHIGALSGNRNLPQYLFSPLKAFLDRVIAGQSYSDYSLHNQLQQCLMQARLSLKTRQFNETVTSLDKLDKLLKTNESTPLNFLIECNALRVELLLCQGKFQEASERAERAWDRHYPVLSLEFRLHYLRLLISTRYLTNHPEKAVQYFEVLEEYKAEFIQLHGEEQYWQLMLLKAALLFEQQEIYGLEVLMAQLEPQLTSNSGQLALSILRNLAHPKGQADMRNVQFLMTRFAEEGDVIVDEIFPDFNLWVRTRLDNNSPGEAFNERLRRNIRSMESTLPQRRFVVGDLSIPQDFLV